MGKKKIDQKGKRFGRLVVQHEVPPNKHKQTQWLCKCDCGETRIVSTGSLKRGTQSCGCIRLEKTKNYLIGERFGKLLVTGESDERSGRQIMWDCMCDCGNTTRVRTANLKDGVTRSCGCLHLESVSRNGTKNSEKMVNHNIDDLLKERTNLALLKSKLSTTNKSGYKGVCWDKGSNKWKAYIYFQNKSINLGMYHNIQDAIQARKEAEEKYFKPILEKYGKE